jgi:hypothetical protein
MLAARLVACRAGAAGQVDVVRAGCDRANPELRFITESSL